MENTKKLRKDTSLIGAAGVHFVASELSLRGLIALPTIRNTAGIDLLAAKPGGSWHANIQVKASYKRVKFWPIGTHYNDLRGPNNYYVFLCYVQDDQTRGDRTTKAAHGHFEAFLVEADRVADDVAAHVAQKKVSGHAEFTPCWYLPSDPDEQNLLRAQWREFPSGTVQFSTASSLAPHVAVTWPHLTNYEEIADQLQNAINLARSA